MEILITSFGEPSDDYEEKERKEVQAILIRLEESPDDYIPVEVRIKNIGRGADWYVVSIKHKKDTPTNFDLHTLQE